MTPILSGFLMDKLGMTVLFPYAVIFVAAAFFTMLFVKHGDSRPVAKKGLEALEDIIDSCMEEGKKVVGHDAYLEAERDANKAISDIFSREVEVDIQPVPMDDFTTAIGDEELTLEQLAFLQEVWIIA